MKLTQILFKQNIARAIRFIWQKQRVRNVQVCHAEQVLSAMNLPVKDALEVINPPQNLPKIEVEFLRPQNKFDETHPDWNHRTCLKYADNNVLQEGTTQACLLTKTIKLGDQLPSKINDLITDIPENVENLVKRIICTSIIYDPEQVKLPKLKDPNRPAWVFPREYGISSTRKMRNLAQKFLQLCESLNGSSIAQNRSLIHDGITSICIDKKSDLLSFYSKIDLLLVSTTLLTPIADNITGSDYDLPDMYPLHHTIGLNQTHFYKTEDIFPLSTGSPWANVHTIFANHDLEIINNKTELPVNEDQIHSRSLIKSFVAAAASARQKFGLNVKHLPEPMTVQCVQSDGQNFHFSVYQLNTLDIDGLDGIKNLWWSAPTMKLFEKAQYENGRPVLEGYNADVFKTLLAFYKNR